MTGGKEGLRSVDVLGVPFATVMVRCGVQTARGILFEVLDEGDDERALRKKSAGCPCDDRGRLFREGELEVGFRGERGDVELFQSLGDALGLRAGKAALLELFDDAIGIDDQCLHR
jgi:hypothetical protein